MKLDSVFIAFLKSDEKEHLFYKKEDVYYDLKTKEKYTINDIDLRTLLNFKDSIKCEKDAYFKFFIKFLYNNDRSQLINIEKLCIGDIKQAIDVERKDINKYRIIRTWYPKHINGTLLEECINGYKDIRDGKKYNSRNHIGIHEGELYVDNGEDSNFKYLRDIYTSKTCLEKSKVLKLQYDIMNNKKIN